MNDVAAIIGEYKPYQGASGGAWQASFTLDSARAAADQFGAFNCGPGALAAILGLTPGDVVPAIPDFTKKGYTSPTMMRAALEALGVRYSWIVRKGNAYLPPLYGLARVQWDGPWTAPGVPARAAYRHTHWIAGLTHDVSGQNRALVFDINAIGVGGWITFPEWQTNLVPWLLKKCEPKATGDWWITHYAEIQR